MSKFSEGSKKFFEGFWHILSNNLGLKIASVVFAVILWGFVMTEINPPREKEFKDIDLRYENSNALSEKELTIKGSLEDILNQVTITVEADPDYLYLITEENINAYVDLSVINQSGEQSVAIKATSSIGTVVDISPRTVTMNVEDYITKTVPVAYEIKNAPGEDYYVSEPMITPESVDISGARSFVEKVVSAVCYIDMHEVTEDVRESVLLVLRDENGEILEPADYNEESPSVIVDVNVMPQKRVPINLKGAIIGLEDVAEGYIVTDYYIEPTTVLVAAEQSILDTILQVQVESIDISGAKSDLSIETNIKQLSDAVITNESQTLTVHVEIAAEETTQIFESVAVEVRNLDEGLVATVVPKTVRVVITDEALLMTNLRNRDLKLYIDVDGLKPGEYSVPILFDEIERINSDNVALSIQSAQVTIVGE